MLICPELHINVPKSGCESVTSCICICQRPMRIFYNLHVNLSEAVYVCQNLNVSWSKLHMDQSETTTRFVKAACGIIRTCVWLYQKYSVNLANTACKFTRTCMWIGQKLHISFIKVCSFLLIFHKLIIC